MGGLRLRVKDECDPQDARRNLLEHLEPFAAHLGLECREPGNVAARMCKTRDKAAFDGIEPQHEHDRYGPSRALQRRYYSCAIREDYVRSGANRLFGVGACP